MSDEPDDDDEEVVVVCARITTPLYMADNIVGKCSECGWSVQFRPHAPAGRRMCMECAGDIIEPGAKVFTTPRMVEEIKAFLRKQKQ